MASPLSWTGRTQTLADGLQVRRVLPAAARRAVGPFVFFDHFGPVTLPAGTDSDIGAHPHIGLATVTYLFEGSFLHRDSLGSVQAITPGAINWMTAGRGIVHSERATDADRAGARRLHGLQLWAALPPDQEAMEPAFQHVGAQEIPTVTLPGGATARVLVGEAWGARSPVRTEVPTLYLDLQLPPAARLDLPALAPEQALYSPELPLEVDGQPLPACMMHLLADGQAARLQAGPQGARLVLIGGAPLQRPVRMWWNFVSVDLERIAQAARDWAGNGFAPIPGDPSRVPAPPWRP